MAVEANRMQLQAKIAEQQELKKKQQVPTRCEDMQRIEQSYCTIGTDSMQDDTGILLLPSQFPVFLVKLQYHVILPQQLRKLMWQVALKTLGLSVIRH